MKGKIVLIKGAAGGIDKQTALMLAKMGAQVIIWTKQFKRARSHC